METQIIYKWKLIWKSFFLFENRKIQNNKKTIYMKKCDWKENVKWRKRKIFLFIKQFVK